jgi:hypothetical protein
MTTTFSIIHHYQVSIPGLSVENKESIIIDNISTFVDAQKYKQFAENETGDRYGIRMKISMEIDLA